MTPGQNHFTGCFELFAKINGMNSDNFKFVKTQFYRRVSEITSTCQDATQVIHKHKYQTVSIPKSCSTSPKFQQKGLIFVWPQRRRINHCEEVTLVAWLLAHVLYWLNNLHLFPSGAALPLKQPPWEYVAPVRKPENRDYIIEPDWDSLDKLNE